VGLVLSRIRDSDRDWSRDREADVEGDEREELHNDDDDGGWTVLGFLAGSWIRLLAGSWIRFGVG
jgi:hypothetical protein